MTKISFFMLSVTLGIPQIYHASEPVNKADCLPNTNPTKDTPNADEYELTCLKRGFKNIWWSGKSSHTFPKQSALLQCHGAHVFCTK